MSVLHGCFMSIPNSVVLLYLKAINGFLMPLIMPDIITLIRQSSDRWMLENCGIDLLGFQFNHKPVVQ